eukprot:Blabericola_migrator_1__4641@NODE_245_length_10909_cov_149_723298_g207_i0_p3_GENE_NODE_245_length_10909_cov_149_723298_g207_i0NODE_245_length_10909_cov_149_723298_g207_i0_p3_ORF_typecomplete_len472_score44_20LmjF365940deam/PF14421_6/4_9e03LmjF365940deam/PF14421_6/1_3e35dCMP_cyt_deam_1/PF00383_23/7_5e02dCMP_cyt_deam_1/PF00383_23/0_078dCMP_cyt_deam_1/PF00383_23/6_5e03Rio2_N/PF09202_11/39Rio2_N/PF09202_11/1_7HTH_45/PF14947_6/4e03HTH_45/PF14947_6/7_4e03HTH_45/PF14947_6/0_48HTH_45/PF14947_6/1_7e03Mar
MVEGRNHVETHPICTDGRHEHTAGYDKKTPPMRTYSPPEVRPKIGCARHRRSGSINSVGTASSSASASSSTTPSTQAVCGTCERQLIVREPQTVVQGGASSTGTGSNGLHNSRWRVSKSFCRIRHYDELKEGDDIRFLVDRMREYLEEFQATEIDSYWHRKSGQIVLAVLLLRYNGELKYTRGINSELSLPSGSTCAERSAITTALSNFLGISRSDFVAIAVLAPSTEPPNPINPCGVCDEWIKKFEEVSPSFTVVTFMSTKMDLFLERCPVTFVEETIDDVPFHLKSNWSCKCGFHLNDAKQAYCSCCKQPRFKFRQHLQQHRWRVLQAIETYNNSCSTSSTLHGVVPPTFAPSSTQREVPCRYRQSLIGRALDSLEVAVQQHPCVVQHLAIMTQLPCETVTKTLRDLLSLKFIEKRKNLISGACSTSSATSSGAVSDGDSSSACGCSTYVLTQLGRNFKATASSQQRQE